MNRTMNSMIKNFVIGIAVLGLTSKASAAVTLSLEPTPQSIGVGDPASVDLVVTGLSDFSPPSLGAFDIDLTYNSAVVSADSVAFGNFLDLGTFGSVRFSDLTTAG